MFIVTANETRQRFGSAEFYFYLNRKLFSCSDSFLESSLELRLIPNFLFSIRTKGYFVIAGQGLIFGN